MKKTILITIMIIIFCASLASATITYTLNSPDNLYATTSTSVTLDWNATSDDTTQPTGMTTWVYLSEVNNDTAVYNTSVLITNTTWGNTTTITSLAEGFYSWYLITNDSDGNTTSLSRWFEIRGSANESDFRWENETGFLAMKLNADNGNLNVYGILAALNLSGNVTWSDIYGFPSACPAGTYLTQLDDSVTCTAITNATGDFNVVGNLTVEGNVVINEETTTEGFASSTDGNLIIGKTSIVGTDNGPNARFQHFWNYTAEGYGLTAMDAQASISTTAAVNMTGSLVGARIVAENNGAHTATEVIGVSTYARASVGTIDTAIGNSGGVLANDASTITDGIGFQSIGYILGSSTLGFTAFKTSVGAYSGTLTKNIGLHVTDVSSATTNNIAVLIGADDIYPGGDYSIYSNTTSSSYFGGNILLDNDANVTWKNGASISVNSTCIILSSPGGTGTHAVCD